jgi:DNA replicative helicase MCM subunit Mcm2 (Cdc46/Mcm family)
VTRDFNIAFYNMPLVNSIRDLKMDKIGQLVSISGTVTRTSEVRPELVSGTFRCEVCKTTISDVEQQFKFTEVSDRHSVLHGTNDNLKLSGLYCCSRTFVQTQHAPIGSRGSSS